MLLNKCPECNGDEYVELVRKQAIEKGVVSAQRGAGAKLPPGAKPDGDDKAGAGDKQLGGEARP